MSMNGNFRQRADECVRLAQKAGTRRDQELFLDMATAWLGIADRDSGKAAIRIGLSVPETHQGSRIGRPDTLRGRRTH